jgi:hypothetical protein
MVAAEGIPGILSVMQEYKQSPGDLCECCEALKEFSQKNMQKNRKVIIQNNGVKTILESMKLHPDNTELLLSACMALEEVSANGTVLNDFVKVLDIKVVLVAMMELKSNSQMQVISCKLLSRVARQRAKDIREANGGEILQSIINEHLAHPEALEQALMAMKEFLVAKINMAGASETLQIIINQHSALSRVLKPALIALKILLVPGTFQNGSCMQAIVQAMGQKAGDADIQGHACEILEYLATNAQDKMAISKAGGIEAIVRAMKKHPEVVNVQKYACRVFWYVAANVKKKEPIKKPGFVKQIK